MMAERTDERGCLPLTPLAFHVLLALGECPRHGYGIIKDIEERTDGRLSLRSGTLYTGLQRLLEQGLIELAPLPDEPGIDTRRRYYGLTALGRRVGVAESARLEALLADARRRNFVAPGESSA